MKFAKYWKKHDVTVDSAVFGREKISIWGASNSSENDAGLHAEKRLASMQAFLKGDFSKEDEYEYWIDFVKEEILDEVDAADGEPLAVLSRNGYGASVLNTDSVVFGDIDISPDSAGLFDRIMHLFGRPKKDKPFVVEQIERYQRQHPSLSFRVYETHSGIRFMLTNQHYSPGDAVVEAMFQALNVDPLYTTLCKQQDCFRARLTPKPWRVGLTRPSSRYPRSSDSEQREFERWLKEYESASSAYTVTKYLASFGEKRVSADIQKVIDIHDGRHSKASADLA
ncbi:hypothetical protein [Enterovibrio norvegicus]|uniref:Uncharacterized protein n=1 Tax=Enterovibrio norvegicus TaxID=188144 RepID=A0ABV4L1Y4_9GAMM|nr:hypothetical protein [Enterovibrio norvegicus]OEF55400.1 hypothetical protein A1OU_23815 [Enterovibrio norvegicus]